MIRLGDNAIYRKIPRELGDLEYIQVLSLHNLNLIGKIGRLVQKLFWTKIISSEVLGRVQSQGEFEQEIGRLGGLSHVNLASFKKFLSFGLTKFLNAVWYIAPELAQSLRVSDKCDVYSYVVVLLLELVTCRKPVESPPVKEILILKDHVRDLLETGSASSCFGSRLRAFEENEMIQVLKLGLVCTTENPGTRPSMAEVVQVLELIRKGMGS